MENEQLKWTCEEVENSKWKNDEQYLCKQLKNYKYSQQDPWAV